MKIYTKQGDGGQTGLSDGTKVPKNHLRLETYGTIDELNSVLGVAATHCRHGELSQILQHVQNILFDLGSDLSTPADAANTARIPRIAERHVTWMEEQIDAATAQLPPLKRFILPGGSPLAAHLHVARTVCRRAERCAVSLAGQEAIGPWAIPYLNRLSDFLFTLARLANKLDGVPDVEWQAGAEFTR